jgi:hypothetical protein
MRFMMLLPARSEPLEKAVAAPNKELVAAMHSSTRKWRTRGASRCRRAPCHVERLAHPSIRRQADHRNSPDFEMADFPPELQRKSTQPSSGSV